jgi:Na+-transporting NADH:ubiquinone oxidoreductase subunit A
MAPDLQVGVDLLKALCSGKIYLCVRGRSQSAEFDGLKGVEQHSFTGPHPSGLVGTHISCIDPLSSSEIIWYLKAQELALLGQWQRAGRFPTQRVIAVSGSEAPKRGYLRVRSGSSLDVLTGGIQMTEGQRIVNGTILNGRIAPTDGFLGQYAQTLTIIPSGAGKRDLFGWLLPQFGKHSASRSVWSWLMPKKEYALDARLNGGHRAIVDIGAMERVMPLDILPSQLIRSIQANDIEEAMSLGLLEVTEEDMALCTFVDPCKLDVGRVIRQGLDLYQAEG